MDDGRWFPGTAYLDAAHAHRRSECGFVAHPDSLPLKDLRRDLERGRDDEERHNEIPLIRGAPYACVCFVETVR